MTARKKCRGVRPAIHSPSGSSSNMSQCDMRKSNSFRDGKIKTICMIYMNKIYVIDREVTLDLLDHSNQQYPIGSHNP